MRTRYRKRLNFGPMRINLSRSGIGTSWGIQGFRITHSSAGRRYMTLSLPGTGFSWQKALGRQGRRTRSRTVWVPQPPSPPISQPPPGSPSLPTTAGTSTPPLVNGVPWWRQSGIQKGP